MMQTPGRTPLRAKNAAAGGSARKAGGASKLKTPMSVRTAGKRSGLPTPGRVGGGLAKKAAARAVLETPPRAGGSEDESFQVHTAAATDEDAAAVLTGEAELEAVLDAGEDTAVDLGGADDNNVRVFVRVRPPNDKEMRSTPRQCVTPDAEQGSVTFHARDNKTESRMFTFDGVGGEETSQEAIFRSLGKPIVDSCMDGYNATIFAYGQTGAGKTFTMQGPDTGDRSARGLIPRVLDYIFALIARNERKSEGGMTYLCRCSYMEIYNEQITDLMDPTSTGLAIREDLKRGVYVDGLLEEDVTCPEDAIRVLDIGSRNRHVGMTSMNRESSRSHSVFSFFIESKEERADGLTNLRFSRLNLVDLAGSERQKATNTAGIRLKEAGNINRSLSALGNVINALVDIANGKTRHIHYRDSKLTFYLKDSLGGNAKTCIIANISPSEEQYMETLSTLKFAWRAKMVKNKAVVNEDASGSVKLLQAEIRTLREELASAQAQLETAHRASSSPLRMMYHPELAVVAGEEPVTVARLEELLCQSLDRATKGRKQVDELNDKLAALHTLSERREKYIQSIKMQLKLRESGLARALKGQPMFDDADARAEIEALRAQVEHHPDAVRFAMENLELRDLIKEYQDNDTDEGMRAQVIELQSHVSSLSTQVKMLLQEKKAMKDAAVASPERRKYESLELEKWKAQQNFDANMEQMRAEIDHHKELLATTEEANKKRQEELEEELAEARRKISEAELALSASKLSEESPAGSPAPSTPPKTPQQQAVATPPRTPATPGISREKAKFLETQIATLTAERVALATRLGECKSKAADLEKSAAQDAIKHEAEVAALQAQIKGAEQSSEARESQVVTLQAELTVLAQQLTTKERSAKMRMQELSAAIETKEAEAMAIEKHLGERESELEAVRSELKAQAEQLETASEEVAFVQSRLDEAEAKHKAAAARAAELETDLKGAQDTIGKLEAEVSAASAGEEELVAELMERSKRSAEEARALQQQLEAVTGEREQMQAEMAELMTDLGERRKREDETRQFVIEMQETMGKLRQTANEKETLAVRLQAERDTAVLTAEEAASDRDILLHRLEELQDKYDAVADDRDDMEKSRQLQITELMGELQKQQAKVEEMRGQEASSEEYLREVETLREMVSSLQEESQQRNDECKTMKRSRRSILSHLESYSQQLEMLKDSVLDKEEIIAKLSAVQTEVRELMPAGDEEQLLARLQDELQDTRRKLQDKIDEHLEVVQQKALLEEALEQARAAGQVREGELVERAALEEALESKAAAVSEAQDKVTALEEALESKAAAVSEAQDKVTALEEALESKTAAVSEAQDKVTALEEALESKAAAVSEAQEQVEALQTKVEATQKEGESKVVEIETELREARQQAAEMEAEHSKALQAKSEELAALRTQFEAVQSDAGAVDEGVYKETVAKLEQTLADKNREIADLRKRLLQFSQQLNEITDNSIKEITERCHALESQHQENVQVVQRKTQAEEVLRSRLEQAQSTILRQETELQNIVAEKGQMIAEAVRMQHSLTALEAERTQWEKEKCALRSEEESAFQTSQQYKTLMEDLKAANAVLGQEKERLRKEVDSLASLSGHTNTKQKIKHLQQLKDENNRLRAENNDLQMELGRRRK